VKKIILSFVIGLMLIAGCDSDDPELVSKIKRVYWVLHNTDKSYWSSFPLETECYIDLSIAFESKEVTLSDIESVQIVPENVADQRWFFDTFDPKYFDDEKCVLYFTHLYAGHIENAIYIGNYIFTVTYKNGSETEYTFNVPAPGELTSLNYKFAATENNAIFTNAAMSPQFVKMINKAVNPVGVIDIANQTIKITFQTSDTRTYSGTVVMFGSDGKEVAELKTDFRSFDTKVIYSIINNGLAIYTDSTKNEVSVSSAKDISYYNSKTFADIKTFCIFLTDGSQYANDPGITFDCVSISKKTEFSYK